MKYNLVVYFDFLQSHLIDFLLWLWFSNDSQIFWKNFPKVCIFTPILERFFWADPGIRIFEPKFQDPDQQNQYRYHLKAMQQLATSTVWELYQNSRFS